MKTKSIFPLFLLASTLLTAACVTPTAKQAGSNSFEWGQVPQQPDLSWADSVGSRQMPGNSLILSANSFGAVADSTVLSTEAIQKAIDSCSVSGGGTVTLQPGYYQTGALFVKSGVNLQLDKGVTLLASPHIHHYPEFRSRIAGIEMTWPAAVINIVNEKNAAVSGEGTLDCRGKVFWDKYWEMRKEYEKKGLRWIVDYDCKRVRGILVERSSDITLKGFTLMRTGFWGCQVLYSNYCTIDGLVINNNLGGHGPSTDGIDIDSSTNILIENCDVDCNDDNICIKSGRDADGLRVNLPTENIVIRNCIARKGAGLITCGSETSGSIRNILGYNLLDTQPIYHFLHQLSIPHPPNASWHETGNITFTLPHPRNGKNPNVYNYIGHNSALIIEKAMEVEMRAELYEFLLENKYCHGIMFKKSMETFVEHYNMVGLVEEESLMRAFQRWRKMMKEEKNR